VSKGHRCAQYIRTFRHEMVKVTEAVGVAHPGLITADDIDVFCGDYEARTLREVYDYHPGWGALGPEIAGQITDLMAPRGLEPEGSSIESGEGEKPLAGSAPTSGR
jgi:hypothetical protein